MSQVANTNFLQPSGFKLVVNREKLPNFEWFVQSVDHPSIGLPVANSSFRRITDVPMTGDKLEFSEVNFNVILDEEMEAYTEIFNWMQRLVEEPHTPPNDATNTRLQSECDLTLLILNSSNNVQKRIKYYNAFPTNLGNIALGAESEPNPILVPMSFQYLRFEIA